MCTHTDNENAVACSRRVSQVGSTLYFIALSLYNVNSVLMHNRTPGTSFLSCFHVKHPLLCHVLSLTIH